MNEAILQEIREEREYQDGKWGTEFDDKNTLNDWAAYINVYLGKCVTMKSNPEEQRKQMKKVATLAVAAMEAFDRNGHFPPRHYEDRVEK